MSKSNTHRQVRAEVLKSIVFCCMCFFVAVFPITGQAQEKGEPEQFSATAFGQSGMLAGKSVSMNIYVSDYSTDQEVEDLAATLKTKGSRTLLKAVQKMKSKGRVAPTEYTGRNVAVVRQHPTKNGRQVVMSLIVRFHFMKPAMRRVREITSLGCSS